MLDFVKKQAAAAAAVVNRGGRKVGKSVAQRPREPIPLIATNRLVINRFLHLPPEDDEPRGGGQAEIRSDRTTVGRLVEGDGASGSNGGSRALTAGNSGSCQTIYALIGTHTYETEPGGDERYGGRGQALRLAPVQITSPYEVLFFSFQGHGKRNLSIRTVKDSELALEVNGRKMQVGTQCSLWYIRGHKEWACRFTLHDDGTIGPHNAAHLVLGLTDSEGTIALVHREDQGRRLQFAFEGNANMERYLMKLAVKQSAAEERRRKALEHTMAYIFDREVMQSFQRRGFVHLRNLVEPVLVNAALREINHQMGKIITAGGVEEFKGMKIATSSAIINLFNHSAIPYLLQSLLGFPSPPTIGGGQLALRFPGDMCPDSDIAKYDLEWFNNLRLRWHIDGMPSDFIPGRTDHFGEARNFDALVGVLLSDIHQPMSGELCCYPGSHVALAQYFKEQGVEDVCNHGMQALPTGPQTDALFGSASPVSCLGKAGDVFVANYLTAHFVAPNCSPHIRYSVYFRVKGPAFTATSLNYCRDSMLFPWLHWTLFPPGLKPKQNTGEEGVGEVSTGDRKGAGVDNRTVTVVSASSAVAGAVAQVAPKNSLQVQKKNSREEINKAYELEIQFLSRNNDHTSIAR